MNWLIGAACLCIIAVSAHYGYSRYSEYQETEQRKAVAIQIVRDKAEKSKRAAEIRREAEEAALKTACDTRVPSQSTESLKRLYQQCMEYNRPLFVAGD